MKGNNKEVFSNYYFQDPWSSTGSEMFTEKLRHFLFMSGD